MDAGMKEIVMMDDTEQTEARDALMCQEACRLKGMPKGIEFLRES